MIQEALELVHDLNGDSYLDDITFWEDDPFSFKSNGYEYRISFLGVELFKDVGFKKGKSKSETEIDGEPLRNFIIRRAKEVLAEMNKRIAQI